MTVVLPAPYGKADWTDYVDYWRDLDVTWVQDRSVVRYADNSHAELTAATSGQTVWLATPDQLAFKSASNRWIGLIGAENLRVSPVNAANADEAVTLSQRSAAGGVGLSIGKTVVSVGTDTDLHGVLKVTGTDVTIQSGGSNVVAKLNTDTLYLISDKAIKSTGFVATGASTFTTVNLATVTATTSLTAPSVTASGALSGNTLSVTTSATIASVGVAGGVVTATRFASDHGRFYGTSASALMRYNDGTTDGVSYFEVGTANVHLNATADFTIEGQTKIFESKGLIYYNGASYSAPGSILGYGGPVVYSTTALTAANYPPGTIWIS